MDGIEWESEKFEPPCSQTKSSMPEDIKVAVNFVQREPTEARSSCQPPSRQPSHR